MQARLKAFGTKLISSPLAVGFKARDPGAVSGNENAYAAVGVVYGPRSKRSYLLQFAITGVVVGILSLLVGLLGTHTHFLHGVGAMVANPKTMHGLGKALFVPALLLLVRDVVAYNVKKRMIRKSGDADIADNLTWRIRGRGKAIIAAGFVGFVMICFGAKFFAAVSHSLTNGGPMMAGKGLTIGGGTLLGSAILAGLIHKMNAPKRRDRAEEEEALEN